MWKFAYPYSLATRHVIKACRGLSHVCLMCLSFRAKKVCYLGTEYRIRAIIQVGYKNELPDFVVVSPSKTYFVLKSIETRQLSSHFQVLDVCFPTMPGTLILLQREFAMHFPTDYTKGSNTVSNSYIVTKYNGPKSYV